MRTIKKEKRANILQTIISNPAYKKYLKIKGESPKIDQEKVQTDELYDGIFVLTTNTKLNPLQIVESYKDLWHIELISLNFLLIYFWRFSFYF